MRRIHLHMIVKDLDESIKFYSTLFGAEPVVKKDDYAKWMLENPRVNFAMTQRDKGFGIDHFGIQVETDEELRETERRMKGTAFAIDEPSGAGHVIMIAGPVAFRLFWRSSERLLTNALLYAPALQ